MSGSNQHVMRINLRRMELSAFIELLSTTSDQKARTRAASGRHRGKAGPSAVPLFDGKPLVAHIEATDVPRTGHAHAPEDDALLSFLPAPVMGG